MSGPNRERTGRPGWAVPLLAAVVTFAVVLLLSFYVVNTVRTPIGKVSFAAGLGVLVFAGVYMNQRSRGR